MGFFLFFWLLGVLEFVVFFKFSSGFWDVFFDIGFVVGLPSYKISYFNMY